MWRKRLLFYVVCSWAISLLFAGSAHAAASAPTLTITLSNDNITVTPESDVFADARETITIGASGDFEYTIGLKTTGTSSSLINSARQTEIPTFTIPAGSETVPRNSTGYGYGYSVDNKQNYFPIPEPTDVESTLYVSSFQGDKDYYVDFGVKVDSNILSGTYENTFIFTVVADYVPECNAGYVCYAGNGDDGTGTMPDQEVTAGQRTTLTPSNFSKPGHGFAGWNTEPDGTGITYGPEEAVSFEYPSEEGIILYAKWVAPSGLMQNWNGCSSMQTNDVIALKDFRDGSVYTVGKLADGNCWMLENSRLDPSSALISKANTNNPTTGFIRAAKNSSSTNTFCDANSSACIDQILYNTNNMNRSLTASSKDNGASVSWYSYGTFYNFHTASAGNGIYDTVSTNVDGDICPAGWRLPTGGNNSDFSSFNASVNAGATRSDANLRKYPVNFVHAGDFNKNITTGRGTQSRLWSSTVPSDKTKVYRYGFSASEVTYDKNYNKWVAFPIRCIAKSNNPAVIGNIHYDANGGTGTMTDDTNVNLYTTAAKENAFTSPTSEEFSYWNTESDGSGVTVVSEDLVAEAAAAEGVATGDTLTLYAIWGSSATVSFDANGGKDAPAQITEQRQPDGSWSFALPQQIPTRIDYTFMGWDTDPDATTATYQAGGTLVTRSSMTTLYAVWQEEACAAGRICYRGNGADEGTQPVHEVSSNSSVNLRSTDFSRDGYGFASWNTAADGTGTNYGPNQSFAVGDVSTEGVTLYANWVESTGNLQNWGGCNELTAGTVIALTDTRDNNAYTVTKLADGHCWFMENLRLDPSKATITAENTNSPTQAFIEEAPTTSSKNTICAENTDACVNTFNYNTNNINRNLTASPTTNNSASSWWSYGVDYNWYVATAGNGTSSISSGSVTGDICPAGWRLPTGGASGEYKALNQAENNGSGNNASGLLKYPVNIIYSGDFNASTTGGRSTYTRLWTSTANNGFEAFRMGVTAGNITHSNKWNKWVAFPVRCIAK